MVYLPVITAIKKKPMKLLEMDIITRATLLGVMKMVSIGTLKTEALAQDFPAALEVREGTLTLEGSTVEGRTFSGVSAILAKAALHLDASDEGSLVCNGNKVAEWLDTRETGSADSGYVYSRAVANTMASLIPELNLSDADLLPIKKAVEGKSGVYFNEKKSLA